MHRGMTSRSGIPSIAILALIAASVLCDAGIANAQGPLRRLGERIRSRIEPLAQPPGVAPNPPAAGNPSDAPDNVPNSATQPRSSALRPVRPVAEPNLADRARTNSGSPSIGIEVAEFNDGIRGVRVVEFQPFSKAAASGLSPGDLIVGVEGRATSSIAEIAARLSSSKPGDTVDVRVVPADVLAAAIAGRGRITTRDLRIPLVSRSPTSGSLARQDDANSNRQTQYEAPRGDARLGVLIDDVRGRQGAMVISVEPESPAAVAKMQTGDRIVSINGRVVQDAVSVTRAVNASQPGDRLRVQWVRGEQLREANVTLAGPDGLASRDSIAAANSHRQAAENAAAPNDSLMSGLSSAIGDLFGAKANEPPANPSAADQDQVNPAEARSKSTPVEANEPLNELAGPSILERPVRSASPRDQVHDVSRELPGPGAVVQTEEMTLPTPVADPLAFGDEEPIKRTGFSDTSASNPAGTQEPTVLPIPAQAEPKSSRPTGGDNGLPQPTAPTTLFKPAVTQLDVQSDPPSLVAVEPPAKGPATAVSSTDQTIQLLRAEIERLRDRIQQLETTKELETTKAAK